MHSNEDPVQLLKKESVHLRTYLIDVSQCTLSLDENPEAYRR